MKKLLLILLIPMIFSSCTNHFKDGEMLYYIGVDVKDEDILNDAKLELDKIKVTHKDYKKSRFLKQKIDSLITRWDSIHQAKELADSLWNIYSNLAIGDTLQGGIIFYLDGNGGGLIAAPIDQSNGIRVIFDQSNIYYQGAEGTAIGTGAQNTIDIVDGSAPLEAAARICSNLILGGYSDWFLPSRDELNEMRVNLYQQGFGGFNISYGTMYWSSSRVTNSCAWIQDFYSGRKSSFYGCDMRSTKHYVRAVRAFEIF